MVIGIIRKTDKDENIIWEIYVDGEDDSIPPLIQEGAAKNCGVDFYKKNHSYNADVTNYNKAF